MKPEHTNKFIITRRCSICGMVEHEYDHAAICSDTWLCPECCEKLRKLIKEDV